MNLEFHYFYRDAGNFKSFGSVIVSNPDSISADMLARTGAELIERFRLERPRF